VTSTIPRPLEHVDGDRRLPVDTDRHRTIGEVDESIVVATRNGIVAASRSGPTP
jgi:hypothetical protein